MAFFHPASEGESQSHLNDSRVSGCDDLSEAPGTDRRIGIVQAGVVQCVEQFKTILQANPLPEGGTLCHGEITIEPSRTALDIAAGCAVSPRRIESESFRGEPLSDFLAARSICEKRRRDYVRQIIAGEARGIVHTGNHREREARLPV